MAVAIFALACSFLVPLGERYLRNRLVHDTRAEMRAVKAAMLAYYRDVGAFPSALADLATEPSGVTGWTGPYLTAEFADETANQDDFTYDAWEHAYLLYATSDSERRLRSLGENGINEGGGGDDLELRVNVSSVLRDLTLRELEEINVAVRSYNSTHLPGDPLPVRYPDALARLQALGFLPADPAVTAALAGDAWGHPYETRGPSPVMEVVSVGSH